MKKSTRQKIRLYTSQFFGVLGAVVFITGLTLTLVPLFIGRLIAVGSIKHAWEYCAEFFKEFIKQI